MSKNSKTKEKQNWASEKPKLDNAKRLRRSYFIDPEISNSRNLLRMHGRSWKSQQSLLCLVKGQIADMGPPVARMMIPNQNLRASMEVKGIQETAYVRNSTENSRRSHCRKKKVIHCRTSILVRAAEEAVDQRMTETWENFDDDPRIWQYILHHWWISVIWRILNYRRNTSNTKIELYFEEISWKTIQTPISRATIISITNDSCKSHGYHFKTTWMIRTSSWDSIYLHSS